MDVRGKVAVVTGSGSGIGRATAARLAGEGALLVVVDVDAAAAGATAAQIEAAGGRAVALHADVSSVTDAQRMLAAAEEHFGGLDILCNNAGVTTGQPIYPQSAVAQWQRVLDVNLRAVILGTQLALPALHRRGGGVIIHTASLAGLLGFATDPVYAATKAAVVMFTYSLAALAAQGIRVNCVCPGLVNTPLLARGRSSGEVVLPADVPMLEPDAIADGIVRLIGDDSVAGRALCIAPGFCDFASPPLLQTSQGGRR